MVASLGQGIQRSSGSVPCQLSLRGESNPEGLPQGILCTPAAGGTGMSSCTQQRDDFTSILGQLVAYKRVDIAVEAFNYLELPFVIIGEGRVQGRLELGRGMIEVLICLQ